MNDKLYEIYQYLKQDGILFCFSGPFSQGILESIGDLLRLKMKLDETTSDISHRVFSTFVEQIQNIINYSAEVEPENLASEKHLRYGVVVVGKRDGNFYVLSGNFIEKPVTSFMVELIEKLNAMDKYEQNEFYRAQRRLLPRKESKGAGLGLIEMARRTSGPLRYTFFSVDTSVDFLSIEAEV